jgi:hypothetical protein
MDLAPSSFLFSLPIKRQNWVVKQVAPCCFKHFFVLRFILSPPDKVIQILVVVVDAHKTHLIEVGLF